MEVSVFGELAILALLAFLYSLVSERVKRMPISGPVVFVLAGLALGPLGMGWFSEDLERGSFSLLVNLTLSLILFSDAASSHFSVLRRQWRLPARLLVIGLPGTILLGTLVAAWLFDALSIYEAAILGVMLAATDAALGKAVIANEQVPIRLREGLNYESGLNDGLCVPFLLLFMALAGGDQSASPVRLVPEEIGVGAGVGVLIGGSGAWLIRICSERGWMDEVWLQTSAPALAFACFAVAQSLHGSGFIAAFVGGMVFGSHLKHRLHDLVVPAEGIGEAMAMLTWLIFGVSVIGQSLGQLSWEILLYSLLSLTILRMVPVFIALLGSDERLDSRMFLGWFGPRGLASIVFTMMVLGENLPGGELISTVVTCTVGLSLIAHGVSASPLASWMAARDRKK